MRCAHGTRTTPCDAVMAQEGLRATPCRAKHSVRCGHGTRSIACEVVMAREALRALRFCREGHCMRCFQIARSASRAKTVVHLQRKGMRGIPCDAESPETPREGLRAMQTWREGQSALCNHGTRSIPCDAMPREALRAMCPWREGQSALCNHGTRSIPCDTMPREALRALPNPPKTPREALRAL